MLKMTDRAAKVIDQAIKKDRQYEGEKLFVRLGMGIGWGGPQLKLSLEEQPLEEDRMIEIDDISFLIHEKDYVYFDHTKLDYVENIFGVGKFDLIKL